jgi:hypothetical protein
MVPNKPPIQTTKTLPITVLKKETMVAAVTAVTDVEAVGSRTWDRAKAGPGLVKKIADLTIFNQSKGKSGSYAHAAHLQPVKEKEWSLCSRGTRGNAESIKRQISYSPHFFKII